MVPESALLHQYFCRGRSSILINKLNVRCFLKKSTQSSSCCVQDTLRRGTRGETSAKGEKQVRKWAWRGLRNKHQLEPDSASRFLIHESHSVACFLIKTPFRNPLRRFLCSPTPPRPEGISMVSHAVSKNRSVELR